MNLELHEKVAQNIEHSQDRMKATYDKKTRSTDVRPGDWVLVRDETRSSALAPLYLGPWLVVEKLGVNLNLIDPGSERKKIVHMNRCKLSRQNRESIEELTVSNSYGGDHASEELDYVETEEDAGADMTVREGPRRSNRFRRDPGRYGDFEGYWHNRGNQKSIDRIFEGEGEMSCSELSS